MAWPRVSCARWLAGVSAGLALAATAAQPEPQALDWSALRPAAAVDVDPFAGLPDHQFEDLAQLVRLDALLAAGQGDPAQVSAQRERIALRLAEQGVPTAELLAERQRVIARRRAQAETTNPAFDGTRVQITGFLVAAGTVPGPDDGAATSATHFLVPLLGACSHRLPPPNQLVRVNLDAQATAVDPRRPVRLTGRMWARPETRAVRMVDGVVPVQSGYSMSDFDVEFPGPLAFATPLTPH